MLSLAILVALSKTEINDVNTVLGKLGASNQKVIGLYITMNDALFMDLFNSLDHLDCNQKYRF